MEKTHNSTIAVTRHRHENAEEYEVGTKVGMN
jgi:hypothetical protein